MGKRGKRRLEEKKENRRGKIEGKKYIAGLIIRYALIVLLSVNSFFIFYYIFKPLTFYPPLFILKLFYSTAGNFAAMLIYVSSHSIRIIGACIAGSAYFLLAALNLMTAGISWLGRIKIFLFSAFLLLIFNISRIIVLAVLLVNGSEFFDAAHFVFWHVISTVFVILTWLLAVKIYKIKAIPLVSDMLYLKSLIKKA